MKNELDSRTVLAVFEQIQKQGEQKDEGKAYKGIVAFSDPDGYTVYLQGSGVLLRVGFHNTYDLEYDTEHSKEDFLAKVEAIAKELD